jgi:hypothetical protein
MTINITVFLFNTLPDYTAGNADYIIPLQITALYCDRSMIGFN